MASETGKNDGDSVDNTFVCFHHTSGTVAGATAAWIASNDLRAQQSPIGANSLQVIDWFAPVPRFLNHLRPPPPFTLLHDPSWKNKWPWNPDPICISSHSKWSFGKGCLTLVRDMASPQTLVLCCISGSGSALFCTPASPLYKTCKRQIRFYWQVVWRSRNKCYSKAIRGGESWLFGGSKLPISCDHIVIKWCTWRFIGLDCQWTCCAFPAGSDVVNECRSGTETLVLKNGLAHSTI